MALIYFCHNDTLTTKCRGVACFKVCRWLKCLQNGTVVNWKWKQPDNCLWFNNRPNLDTVCWQCQLKYFCAESLIWGGLHHFVHLLYIWPSEQSACWQLSLWKTQSSLTKDQGPGIVSHDAARLPGHGQIPKQLSHGSLFSCEGDATGSESAASVSSVESAAVDIVVVAWLHGISKKWPTGLLLLYTMPCVLCNCILFAVAVTSLPSGYH